MSSDVYEAEWKNLAEQASREMDGSKLLDLVTELNWVLERGERKAGRRPKS
jgi:hypothetical protein